MLEYPRSKVGTIVKSCCPSIFATESRSLKSLWTHKHTGLWIYLFYAATAEKPYVSSRVVEFLKGSIYTTVVQKYAPIDKIVVLEHLFDIARNHMRTLLILLLQQLSVDSSYLPNDCSPQWISGICKSLGLARFYYRQSIESLKRQKQEQSGFAHRPHRWSIKCTIIYFKFLLQVVGKRSHKQGESNYIICQEQREELHKPLVNAIRLFSFPFSSVKRDAKTDNIVKRPAVNLDSRTEKEKCPRQ